MKVVVFTTVGTSGVPWTADEDCTLIGMSPGTSTYVVSFEPDLTFAGFSTPAVSSSAERFAVANGASAPVFVPLNIPISAGSTLFVAFRGVGSATLLFDTQPILS